MPRRISPTLLDLPGKHYFTIGEVSHLTWIKPYLLRNWETHFKSLRPARRESGHRKYTRKDIHLIQRIRKLLFDEKLTVEGARKQLIQELKDRPVAVFSESGPRNRGAAEVLREIKEEIRDMSRELEKI